MSDDSPSSSSSSASSPDPGLPRALLVVVALAGLALRIAVLATPLGRPDADELLSGLMARHIASDGFPWFVWGQDYGGTAQLLPVWLSTKVFGSSVTAMRIPNLVLAGVNCVLLWRLTRRFLEERQAQVAGALLWVGPPVAVWFGLREQLFYPPTVTFGLLLAVCASRVRESDGDRLSRWAVLGLVAGLGWWTSSNLVYFAIPAGFVLFHPWRFRGRGRTLGRGMAVAVAAAVVGALPWILDNVLHDFAALRAGGKFPVIGTYPGRLSYYVTDGLPGVLGFREVFTYHWVAAPLGVVAYLAVLAVLARPAVRAVRALEWDGVGFVAFPFVFALLPMVMDDPNMRYLFFVVPFIAALLARAVGTTRGAIVALTLTLVVSVVGLGRMYAVSETEPSGFKVGNVAELDDAIAALDREGITRVYGDYWVAYRLDWDTEERIIASSTWGTERHAPYDEAVARADRVAWVVQPGVQEDALRKGLDALGVPYRVVPAGAFSVVIPARNVAPGELPDAARHG